MNNQQALNAFITMFDEDIRLSTAVSIASDLGADLEEALDRAASSL